MTKNPQEPTKKANSIQLFISIYFWAIKPTHRQHTIVNDDLIISNTKELTFNSSLYL